MENEGTDISAARSDERIPVTILFSDIKGTTAYFETKGDVEGVAMIERHNALLLPCAERNSGRLVKTIGDALMLLFREPLDAVRAAVAMQNALVEDGRERAESDQIHIRIGIHSGLGLIREGDVYGDVVNAASRVQDRSQPDQILITESIVDAAEEAGCQVRRLGRTKLEGKEEPIEIFAMSWSARSTQRLIDDLQSGYEDELDSLRQKRRQVEEEFETARAGWRSERRDLHADLERLEEALGEALERARAEITEDFRSEIRFQLGVSEKAREQAERDLEDAHGRFAAERSGYAAQIENLEKRLIDALDRVNNPTRGPEASRQFEERLGRAREQWQRQWETERQQLTGEIERLRATISRDPVAEARRQVQERLRQKQEGKTPAPAATSESLRKLESENAALTAKVQELEKDAAELEESVRREVTREIGGRYAERSQQASRVQGRLEEQIRALEAERAGRDQSWAAKLTALEETIPEAQEAARRETLATMEVELQASLEASERARSGLERRLRDQAEEFESERGQWMDRIEVLERKLEEARDLIFRRTGDPAARELDRFRHQLEEEYLALRDQWDEEKRQLRERIEALENVSSPE